MRATRSGPDGPCAIRSFICRRCSKGRTARRPRNFALGWSRRKRLRCGRWSKWHGHLAGAFTFARARRPCHYVTRSLTRLARWIFGFTLHARYRMQKIISLLAVLGLAAFSTGCAGLAASSALPESLSSLNPNTTALEIHNQTELKLSEGNFSVVKTNVVGQARGFALLGFITLVPARFQTAMDQLYSKAGMQSGQPQTL